MSKEAPYMFHYFSEENLAEKNGQSASITIKNWLLLMCLGFLAVIPFVGIIAFLVLYIMLAFRAETAVSISAYIKANLLLALISTAIAIVLVFIFGVSLGTALLHFSTGY